MSNTEALDTLDGIIINLTRKTRAVTADYLGKAIDLNEKLKLHNQAEEEAKAKILQYVDSECLKARKNEVGLIDMGDIEYPSKRLTELNTGGN